MFYKPLSVSVHFSIMVYLLVNILLATIPSILVLLIIYAQNRNRQDSMKKSGTLILWSFFIGFAALVPAIFLEELANPYIGLVLQYLPVNLALLIRTFVIAAFIEEGLKLIGLRIFIFPSPDFNKATEGIAFGAAAGLGFALFENILYSFGAPTVLLLRGISAVPLHALASGIMGYYISQAKFGSPEKLKKGFLWAFLIHGTYNTLLVTGGSLSFLVIPLLLIVGTALLLLHRKALDFDILSGRA